MTEHAADSRGPADSAARAARARRELWIWLTPVLLALALLSIAGASRAWAPRGWMPEPLLGLVLLGGALAGALHRPFGGASLALGAVIVYPGFEHLGIVPVAVLVPFALAGAELLQRWIEAHRDLPLPERRSLSRLAGWVAIAELSVLAAGAIFLLVPDRFALAAMVSALVWLAIPAAYELIIRRSVRRESALDFLRSQTPLLYDLAGLVLGALVVVVAGGAGWVTAWVVLGAFALLAGEAARNGLAAAGHVRRLDEAHRLRRAGAALAEGGAGILGVAEQVRTECAALLPFSWFQLELEAPDLGRRSWSAAAAAPLEEGEPQPPPQPPALPGIHRRGAWHRLERTLAADGVRLGELRLWCDPRRLEPRAAEMLDALLPQMGASVRGALLDRATRTDRLTGAASRRVLEQRLAEAFAVAREEGRSMAVVLCDLDHFKRINDSFGHAAGDRALAAVAAVLLAPNRGRDLCARFGGEEFVLLFEETDGETALEISERLRRRIEALEIDADGRRLELTMSFGVAAFPELHVRGPGELLELADAALYTAKHLGRNLCLLDIGGGTLRTAAGDRVEVAEPPEPRAPVFFA